MWYKLPIIYLYLIWRDKIIVIKYRYMSYIDNIIKLSQIIKIISMKFKLKTNSIKNKLTNKLRKQTEKK